MQLHIVICILFLQQTIRLQPKVLPNISSVTNYKYNRDKIG